MNPFTTYTFKWWQISCIKVASGVFGIIIGAYWSEFFSRYYVALAAILIVLGIYLTTITLQKIR